jgi:hypothetical protein
LTGIVVSELPELQVNHDQGPKSPVEEEQVNPVPFIAHSKPPVAGNEREIDSQLQQEMFELAKERLFEVIPSTHPCAQEIPAPTGP